MLASTNVCVLRVLCVLRLRVGAARPRAHTQHTQHAQCLRIVVYPQWKARGLETRSAGQLASRRWTPGHGQVQAASCVLHIVYCACCSSLC